jgi:glycerate-2-kinase
VSIILNKEGLLESNSELRRNALDILEAGYSAILPEKILKENITMEEGGVLCIKDTGFQCSFYDRIFFIGIGKCAFEGAKVVEEILGDHLTDGMVIDVKAGVLKKIRSFAGTHPYPSEVNISLTEQVLNMVKGVTERDLVLVLVSGGGSSLLCLPHDMSCETLINITKTLTKKGADIFELNTVRKHFSEIQGGGLAKVCYPAQVVSLIFSDVLGNDLSMVASGPTVYDKTTVADAAKILLKYDVLKTCIPPDCQFLETPKHPKYFTKVKNVLVCSNLNALEAMREKAEELGFNAHIENTMLSGEASEVGKSLALREPKAGSCILFGGETTVEIKGDGSGGRNQELALSALPYMQPNSLLISASSDGWDNTDHAGALVDQELLEKAKNLNLSPEEYLAKSDSYNFFKQARDGALCTGRLGSNVSDLVIMLYR